MLQTMRILLALVALLVAAGAATAQNAPCPECDEDGAPDPENTYTSADVGVVEEGTEVLADTDAAAKRTDDGGFFGWLSLCLGAFLQHVEDLVGVTVDADARAEVFASDDGVDVDATATGLDQRVDFDESELGSLDGETWDAMKTTKSTLADEGVAWPALPEPPVHPEGPDVDACVHAEHVGGC